MDAVAARVEPVIVSQTETVTDAPTSPQPVLRLRLHKPKSEKKVNFREGTVDNEHMGKKKSKCNGCCIYKKPVAFGESSSEDDEECEHCFGHPEKRRKNLKPPKDDEHGDEHFQPGNSEHVTG